MKVECDCEEYPETQELDGHSRYCPNHMKTPRIEEITQRIGKIFWDDFNAVAEELVRKEVTKAHQAGRDEAVEITRKHLLHKLDPKIWGMANI